MAGEDVAWLQLDIGCEADSLRAHDEPSILEVIEAPLDLIGLEAALPDEEPDVTGGAWHLG